MSDRTCLVNVMVRVTKDVNENVVIPSKQSKSFGNLVSTLLEGYYTNKYVRAYVEGMLSELEEESSKQFNEQIHKMMGSISSMGIYTDELKNVNDAGRETFEDVKEDKKNVKNDIMDERVKKLEDGMSELKDQNAQMLELLKQISSGAVQVVKPAEEVETPVEEEVDEKPVYEEETIEDKKALVELSFGMYEEG